MKNQQRGIVWTPILIIVATILVASIAGYFLFKAGNTNENKNTNVAVVNQVNTNTNTNSAINTNRVANSNTTLNTNAVNNTNSATDPTAGWKTFSNATYGYSIKYPSTWTAQENWSKNISILIPPDAASKTSNELAPYVFITPDREYSEHSYVTTDNRNVDLYRNQRTVTINGVNAKRQQESGLSDYEVIYFPVARSRYISVSWSIGFDYPEYETILSTFQFTN